MNLPKYQIFVSSTYEDLKEERDQVIKATLTMGHIPVGMEMFSAADEEQWKIITRQIDQCDYYVVIVAHRYGSMVNNISYTEKEYDYAVQQGIPVLGFIIKPDALWPGDRRDTEPRKQRALERFRKKVKSKPVAFWSTAEELKSEYIAALVKQANINPRPGWVRATEIAGPDVLTELSRLSSENANLRRQIEENKPIQPKPDLQVTFHDGSNNLLLSSSDWLQAYEAKVGRRSVSTLVSSEHQEPSKKVLITFPPRTALVKLHLSNMGNLPATDVRLIIRCSEGVDWNHIVHKQFLYAPKFKGEAWYFTRKDKDIVLAGDKLIQGDHIEIRLQATFDEDAGTYEWTWECHAENMLVKTQGVLTVRVSDQPEATEQKGQSLLND